MEKRKITGDIIMNLRKLKICGTTALITLITFSAAGIVQAAADKPAKEPLPKEIKVNNVEKYGETIRCLTCIDDRKLNPAEQKACDAACAKAGLK
jgi:hypothetical protein